MDDKNPKIPVTTERAVKPVAPLREDTGMPEAPDTPEPETAGGYQQEVEAQETAQEHSVKPPQ